MMVDSNYFSCNYIYYMFHNHYFEFFSVSQMWINLSCFSNYYFQHILYPIHQYLNFITNLLSDFIVIIFVFLIILPFLLTHILTISLIIELDLFPLKPYWKNQQLAFIINMTHNFIVILFLIQHNHYFLLKIYIYF